jgi:hypothetical protein
MSAQRVLTKEDVHRILKEEIRLRKTVLEDKLKMMFKDESDELHNVISTGLKIRKKTGELFTVEQVGSWGVTLSFVSSNGKKELLKVDKETLERDYEL